MLPGGWIEEGGGGSGFKKPMAPADAPTQVYTASTLGLCSQSSREKIDLRNIEVKVRTIWMPGPADDQQVVSLSHFRLDFRLGTRLVIKI